MGRISLGDAGKYASSGSNDFFTLVDDGDRANVTFLYDDPEGEDVDYFVVHEVQIDGKRRYVNCNAVDADGGAPHPENCPLCQESYPVIEKLFLQLFNHDTGKVETWDRGRSYVAKIVNYINKYGSLVTQPFEIIRSGRKGDQNTSYEFLPNQAEPDATLEDYDPKTELLGTLIVEGTTDEMWDMIDGRFSLNKDDNQGNNNNRRGSQPTRRTAQTSQRQTSSRQSPPQRQARQTEAPARQTPVKRAPAHRDNEAPPVRRGTARSPRSRF